MALNYGAMFNLNASVTGTQSITSFTGQLNTVGRTADTVNKQMAGLRGAIQMLASGFAGSQVAGFVNEMARATIQLDAYSKQLSVSFGAGSSLELETLRNTMRSLGIAQDEALGSAVRFTAAMKLSGQSTEEANRSFAAASKLILSNKLSADGAQRVFYAMSQIASKGKLMSEELSGQLAENIGGIQAQVAKAMNISTAQLLKNMQDGKVSAQDFFTALNKIGDGIDPSSLNSAAKSLGELKNAFFDLKSSILDAETIKTVLDDVTGAIKLLTENAEELKDIAVALAAAFVGLSALKIIVPAVIAMGTAFAEAAALIARFGLVVTSTFYATSAFGAGAGGLAAILAGPWGVAIAAAIGALVYFGIKFKKYYDEVTAGTIALDKLREANNRTVSPTQALSEEAQRAATHLKLQAEVADDLAKKLYNVSFASLKAAQAQADLNVQTAKGRVESAGQRDTRTGLQMLQGVKQGTTNYDREARSLAQQGLDRANIDKAMADANLARVQSEAKGIVAGLEAPPKPIGGPVAAATKKDDPFLSALGNMKGNAAQLIAEIGAWDKYDIKIKGSQEALARFETADPLGKFFKESELRKLAFVAEGAKLDQLKKTTDGLRAYQSASESLGGKEAELKFKVAYFDQYKESTRSANAALLDFEIAEGKYYGRTADEISALRSKAQAVDTLTDSVRRQQALIRDARDLEIAKVSNQQEIAALRDEPLALTMSAFAYQQLTERKQELAKINEEAVKKEPENRQAYINEQIAALNLRQEIERVNEAKRQSIAGGTAAALTSYGDEIAKLGDHVASAWQNALKGTEDALVNFAMTGKLSFKELASSIVADLMRIAIQQAIMLPITLALRTAGLPFANGGAFSGGNQVSVNANGNAFGSQGVTAFASGGVVNRPTMFRHGGGLGVMGEAGPEAIMPLRRLGNGRLGVETTGSGGGTQNVVVNVSVEGGGSQASGDPGKANELGKLVANAVRVELVQQKRPGGLLAA
jgi:lambda family phage tail tape measure protein